MVKQKTSPKRGSVSISSSLLGELEDGLGLVQVPLIIHLCSYQILSLRFNICNDCFGCVHSTRDCIIKTSPHGLYINIKNPHISVRVLDC